MEALLYTFIVIDKFFLPTSEKKGLQRRKGKQNPESMLALNMRLLKKCCNLDKIPRSVDSYSSKGFFRFQSRQALRRKVAKNEGEKRIQTSVAPSTTLPSVEECVKTAALSTQNDNAFIANEKLFKKVLTAQRSRTFREKKQQILLEGPELINVGLDAGFQLDKLFYSKEESLCLLNTYQSLDSVKKYRISDRAIRELMEMSSSKIVAVCDKPLLAERHETFKSTIPVTLLCSDIRDPSNMASVLTLAVASGCKKVLLLKGCVDIWERKVLYYSNGIHFHIPIINNITWDEIQGYVPENAVFYIADSSSDVDFDDSQFCNDDDNDHKNMDPDSSISKEGMPELDAERETFPHMENKSELQVADTENLACKLYSEISFPNEELFLYIGGETVGINSNINILANKLNAVKIKLPLQNGIDSLNVGVALSIILFEMKRQFTQNHKIKY